MKYGNVLILKTLNVKGIEFEGNLKCSKCGDVFYCDYAWAVNNYEMNIILDKMCCDDCSREKISGEIFDIIKCGNNVIIGFNDKGNE
jgi:hypothetical protein